MSSLLTKLVGQRVVIWTLAGNASVKDDGILEEFDGVFVRLNSDGETLVFPTTAIRLIKVIQ